MIQLIDSLPNDDVDDEIINVAKAILEGTKSDTEGYMQSKVSTKAEAGKSAMDTSTKNAVELVKIMKKCVRHLLEWMVWEVLVRMHALNVMQD